MSYCSAVSSTSIHSRSFYALVLSRRRFEFVHSLKTERTLLNHHVALFYVQYFVSFQARNSFITGFDQGCRVEVRRRSEVYFNIVLVT